MKGEYKGSHDAGSNSVQPGERILVWLEVVRTHDRSNHLVDVGGTRFNLAAEALSAAEPTASDLKAYHGHMRDWEEAEAQKRQDAEDAAAATAG